MPDCAWFAFFAVLIAVFALVEGKRQEKKYGRASGRPNLLGVSMLETQKILQADREVTELQEQLKDEWVFVENTPEAEDPKRRRLS